VTYLDNLRLNGSGVMEFLQEQSMLLHTGNIESVIVCSNCYDELIKIKCEFSIWIMKFLTKNGVLLRVNAWSTGQPKRHNRGNWRGEDRSLMERTNTTCLIVMDVLLCRTNRLYNGAKLKGSGCCRGQQRGEEEMISRTDYCNIKLLFIDVMSKCVCCPPRS